MFLFYVNVGMSYALYIFGSKITNVWEGKEHFPQYHGLLAVVNIILIVFLIMGTIILFINQIHLIAHNTTKIELWTKHWATRDAKERGEEYAYPYDKGGVMKNFRDFFGPRVLTWFWPTVPLESDGLRFMELVPTQRIESFV